MKAVTVAAGLVLAGCAAPNYDLSPMPVASSSDPQWIQDFDTRMMEEEQELLAAHRGSTSSKISLWKSFACVREVDVARLRAANWLMEQRKVSRSDAISIAGADPGWVLAEQNCW